MRRPRRWWPTALRVHSSVVASQVELHARYRGVVPEIASRAHIENILPVSSKRWNSAGVKLADVEAVGVAHRPGLIGSLLIGVTAAKTLAWALGKPLIGVDHVHADCQRSARNGSSIAHARRRIGMQRRAHGTLPHRRFSGCGNDRIDFG